MGWASYLTGVKVSDIGELITAMYREIIFTSNIFSIIDHVTTKFINE